MLGDSEEDRGFVTNQKPTVVQTNARRAVLSFPWLREALVPTAFTANCHSDVSLAARHAYLLAPMMAESVFDPALNLFSAKRFDVPAAP
jgi:hypothetical protein